MERMQEALFSGITNEPNYWRSVQAPAFFAKELIKDVCYGHSHPASQQYQG